MTVREIDTPHGPARAHLSPVDAPRALLVLGHGAGGGVSAPDLVTAAEEAIAAGVSVALVEQPYRVAGRKSPAPAHQLDAAWLAVVQALRGEEPLLCGGRRRLATRHAVGLLDERDGDVERQRGVARRHQVGRADPAPGAVAEHERRARRAHVVQLDPGGAVRCRDLPHGSVAGWRSMPSGSTS